MNPKAIALSLTASLLLSTGCAAKNRWFSRKDYSEVQDPFMEGSEVASSEEGTGDTSGRAKLGSSTLASGSGPKPITRSASSTQPPATNPAAGSRATASYPDDAQAAPNATKPPVRSLSGSDLSQFLNSGGKALPPETASADRAGLPGSNLADPKSAASRPSAGSLSPAARAASMPTLEEEEASFSGFMQKQTNAISSTAQKATNKVQETEDSASDFASWASQQKAQWTQEGQAVTETVKSAPSSAKNKIRAASHETKAAVNNAAVDFMDAAAFEESEGSSEDMTEEPAEPLFNPARTSSARTQKAQPIPTQSEEEFEFASPSTDADESMSNDEPNPFENPFDMEEEQAVQKPVSKKPAAAKKSSRPTIDESFDMDSGWKPSGVSRP